MVEWNRMERWMLLLFIFRIQHMLLRAELTVQIWICSRALYMTFCHFVILIILGFMGQFFGFKFFLQILESAQEFNWGQVKASQKYLLGTYYI